MSTKVAKTKVKAKNAIKSFSKGRLYITATLNNTLVTFTDENGQTLAWSSSGGVGFKGSRKATPYASTTAVETVLNKIKNYNIQYLDVFLKGPGTGRDAALRVLRATPFKINQIIDITPLPHNGARQPKTRRI